jgi:predicted DNA-binding protein
MAKTLMFKLRLDDADRERLDRVAEHYSAPAATVIRILIKKEFDAVGLAASAPARLAQEPAAAPRRRRPAPLIPTSDSFVSHGAHMLSESPRKTPAKKKRRRSS